MKHFLIHALAVVLDGDGNPAAVRGRRDGDFSGFSRWEDSVNQGIFHKWLEGQLGYPVFLCLLGQYDFIGINLTVPLPQDIQVAAGQFQLLFYGNDGDAFAQHLFIKG